MGPPASSGVPELPGARRGPRGTERPQLYLRQDYQPPSLSLGKQDPQEEVASNSAFSPLSENFPQARESRGENAPVIPHCAYDPGGLPTQCGEVLPSYRRAPGVAQRGSGTDAEDQQESGWPQSESSAPRCCPDPLLPHTLLPSPGKTQVSDPLCSALPRDATPVSSSLGGSKCLIRPVSWGRSPEGPQNACSGISMDTGPNPPLVGDSRHGARWSRQSARRSLGCLGSARYPILGFKRSQGAGMGRAILPAAATGQAGSRASRLYQARTASTPHLPTLPAPALTSASVLTQARRGGSSGSKEARPQTQSQCPPNLSPHRQDPRSPWSCSGQDSVPGNRLSLVPDQ